MKELKNHLMEDKTVQIYECMICFEQVFKEESERLCNKGHRICKKCLKEYIEKSVEKGNDYIRCPYPLCKGILSERLIYANSNKEIQWKLSKNASKALIYKEKHFTCPNCNIEILINKTKQTTTCPICNKYTICNECLQKEHPGKRCEQVEIIRSRPPGYRICPNCNLLIVKTEACNHIYCECGKHFCYYCGKGPFNTEDQCYKHMRVSHIDIWKNPPDYDKYILNKPIPKEKLEEFYIKYPYLKSNEI